DIAERVAAGRLVDRQQRRLGRVGDVARERVDVEIADAVLDLPLDRTKLDPFTNESDVERLVAAGSDDGQLDAGPGVALHLLDRLIERDSIQELAVDVGDVVAGLDARAPRR